MMKRLAISALLVLMACQRGTSVPATDSATAALPDGHVPVKRASVLPAQAQAVLDTANEKYAAADYTGALAGYRRVLKLAPGHPAPWFGISMAANMLGDTALADSARTLLQSRGVEAEADHGAAPAPMPASPHGGPPKAG